MAEKQLIVVVEGTAAMGPFWQTVVSDYIEKIVRYSSFPSVLSSHSCLSLQFLVRMGKGSEIVQLCVFLMLLIAFLFSFFWNV